jgi:hypothetical protein
VTCLLVDKRDDGVSRSGLGDGVSRLECGFAEVARCDWKRWMSI